jgi:hypothetical protein
MPIYRIIEPGFPAHPRPESPLIDKMIANMEDPQPGAR